MWSQRRGHFPLYFLLLIDASSYIRDARLWRHATPTRRWARSGGAPSQKASESPVGLHPQPCVFPPHFLHFRPTICVCVHLGQVPLLLTHSAPRPFTKRITISRRVAMLDEIGVESHLAVGGRWTYVAAPRLLRLTPSPPSRATR